MRDRDGFGRGVEGVQVPDCTFTEPGCEHFNQRPGMVRGGAISPCRTGTIVGKRIAKSQDGTGHHGCEEKATPVSCAYWNQGGSGPERVEVSGDGTGLSNAINEVRGI